MGREIRRVPANWEHPKNENGYYFPLLKGYEEDLFQFQKDIDVMGLKEAIDYWGGGPRSERYVHYEGKLLDWWQAYETVSEGTPVSPAFASPEELIEYLVINGDFWDQKRKESGMSHLNPINPNHSREAIEAFVRGGWAPSMAIIKGKLYSGIDSLTAIKEEVDEPTL